MRRPESRSNLTVSGASSRSYAALSSVWRKLSLTEAISCSSMARNRICAPAVSLAARESHAGPLCYSPARLTRCHRTRRDLTGSRRFPSSLCPPKHRPISTPLTAERPLGVAGLEFVLNRRRPSFADGFATRARPRGFRPPREVPSPGRGPNQIWFEYSSGCGRLRHAGSRGLTSVRCQTRVSRHWKERD